MTSKYALVIGASKESIFAIKKAKKYGLTVIGFDGNQNAEGLKYVDEKYVTDIREPQNIIKYLEAKNITPSIVLPVPIGRYLITSGVINDYYNLKGPGKEITDICTDKYLFHQTLVKAGLRNVNCKLLKAGDILSVEELNFPVIMKPRFGSGNRDVIALSSPEDFKKQVIPRMPFDEDMLFETLVDGQEYGIDAAVIKDSERKSKYFQVLVREKLLTSYPYTQCVGYYSGTTSADSAVLINEFMQKVVSALELKEGLLHADIILNNNYDAPFLIELSPRPSGHNLHNLFTPYATGVDMLEEYIKYVFGDDYNFIPNKERLLMLRFFDFENCVVEGIPDFQDIKEEFSIIDYCCNIKNDRLSMVTDGHSVINRGFFIIEGNNKKNLDNKSKSILSLFKLKKIGGII